VIESHPRGAQRIFREWRQKITENSQYAAKEIKKKKKNGRRGRSRERKFLRVG